MRIGKLVKGFTLIEVLVAIAVVSIVALGSLSALRLFFKKDADNDSYYKITASYKSIKNRFHAFTLGGETIKANYQCVASTSPITAEQTLQAGLCDEEVSIDPYQVVKITLTPSFYKDAGNGQCVYQVNLSYSPLIGNAINRSWAEQISC